MAIPIDTVKDVCTMIFDLYEVYEDYTEQMEDLTIVLYSLEKIVADRSKIDVLSKASDPGSPAYQLSIVFKQVKATIDYFRVHKTVAQKLIFGVQVKNKMEDLERLTRRLERILKMIELETQTASSHSLALLAGQQATNFIVLRHMKAFWSINFGSKTRIPWQDFRIAVVDQYGTLLQEHLGHETNRFLRGLRATLDHDGDGIIDVREFASLVNPKSEAEAREQKDMNFVHLLFSQISKFEGTSKEPLSILVMGGHTADITLLEHIPPFVISADNHGMISIWNVDMIDSGLDYITTIRTFSERLTSACIFDRHASSGIQMCFGGSDGDLCIIDVYSSKIVGVVDNYGVGISDLCCAEGKLFVCGKHNFVTVYSVAAKSKMSQLHGHKGEVLSLSVFGQEEEVLGTTGRVIAPDYVLISGSADGELRGWKRDLTPAWVVACPTPLAVTKLYSTSIHIAVLQQDERRPARVLLLQKYGDEDIGSYETVPVLQAVLMEDEDECEIDCLSLSEKFLAYTVKTTARARNRNNLRCLEVQKMNGNMLASYDTWKTKYESHAARQPQQLLVVKGHLLWGNDRGTLHNAPIIKAASCPKGHMLQVRSIGVPKLVPCDRCGQNCCLLEKGQQGCWYNCPLCSYDLCADCVGAARPVPQLLLSAEFDDLSPQNSPRAGATLLSGQRRESSAGGRRQPQYSATNARLTLRSGCGIWTPHCSTQEPIAADENAAAAANSSSSPNCSAVFTRDRIISCGGGTAARVFDTQGKFLWSHTLLEESAGLWLYRSKSRRSTLAINTAAHLNRKPFTPSITALSALHRASEKAIPFLFLGTDQGQLGVFSMDQNSAWELCSQHQLLDIERECCSDCGCQLLTAHERFSRCCFSCVRVKSHRVRPKIHIPKSIMWKPPSTVRKGGDDTAAHKVALAFNKWKKKQVWVQHGMNGLEFVYTDEGVKGEGKAKIIPLDNATVEKIPSEEMKNSGCDMTVIGNGWKIITPDREVVLATIEDEHCDIYVETLHPEAVAPQYQCYHCKSEYVSRGKILCRTCIADQRQKLQVRIVSISVNRNRSVFVGCESASCPGGFVVELPLKYDAKSAASVTLLPPIEGGTLWRWRPSAHTLCSFGIDDEYFASCDGKFAPYVKVFLVDSDMASMHLKRPVSVAPSPSSPPTGKTLSSMAANPDRANPMPTATRARHVCSLEEINAPVTALHAPSLHTSALEHRTAAERNLLYAASQDCRLHLYVLERTYHPERTNDHHIRTQLRGVFLWLQTTECNVATSICATPRTVSAGFKGGGILVWSGVKSSINDSAVNYTVGPILKLLGHSAPVSCMGLSPSGGLFSQGDDNTVHFWDFVPLLRQAFHTKRRMRKAKKKKATRPSGAGNNNNGTTPDDLDLESMMSFNTCSSFGEVDDLEEGASTFFDPLGNLISGMEDPFSASNLAASQQPSAGGVPHPPGTAAPSSVAVVAEDSSDDDSHIDHDQWLWNWQYVVDETNRTFVTENEFDLCRVESYTVSDATTGGGGGGGNASASPSPASHLSIPQNFCQNTCRQLNDLWSDVRDFGARFGEVEDPNFGLMIIAITETGEWMASSSENVKAKMRIIANVEIAKVSDTIFLHSLCDDDWNDEEDVRHGSEIELTKNAMVMPGEKSETAVEMLLQMNTSAVASHQAFSQLRLVLKFHILTFHCDRDTIDVTFYFAKSGTGNGQMQQQSPPSQQPQFPSPLGALGSNLLESIEIPDDDHLDIEKFVATAPFKRAVTVDRYDTEMLVPFDDFQNELFTDFRKRYICVAKITSSSETHHGRHRDDKGSGLPATLRCVLSQRDRNPILAAQIVPSCWGPDTIPPVVQAQEQRRLPSHANPTFEEKQFQHYRCRACGHNPGNVVGHKWTCRVCKHGKINQPHNTIRCPICRRRLGIFNRRNCNSCGEMVCLSCSSHRKANPKTQSGISLGFEDAVHVCAVCYNDDPNAQLFAPTNIDML